MNFRSFANGVSEGEPIVRWKEDDEEKKVVCLVVATVVQVVVEMVVKLGEEDGFLEVFLVKEVEEDGVCGWKWRRRWRGRRWRSWWSLVLE